MKQLSVCGSCQCVNSLLSVSNRHTQLKPIGNGNDSVNDKKLISGQSKQSPVRATGSRLLTLSDSNRNTQLAKTMTEKQIARNRLLRFRALQFLKFSCIVYSCFCIKLVSIFISCIKFFSCNFRYLSCIEKLQK